MNFERQIRRGDLNLSCHQGFRDRSDAIALRVGRVNDYQLVVSKILRIIFRFTFCQLHRAFRRERIGQQLPKQQQNQTAMNQMNAKLLSRQFESRKMRRQQICEQHSSKQVTTGENRDLPMRAWRRPIDQEASEVARLRLIKSFINLRQRADKHQHDRDAEAHHSQLQRGQNFE